MSNFDIKVERNGLMNRRMDGKGDAYVAKSGDQGDVSGRVRWLFSLVVD